MHDHVGAPQRLDRLAVVGQIGDELLAVERVRTNEVDAQHVQTVRGKLRDDRTTRLAGPAGDDDARQRDLALSMRVQDDGHLYGECGPMVL